MRSLRAWINSKIIVFICLSEGFAVGAESPQRSEDLQRKAAPEYSGARPHSSYNKEHRQLFLSAGKSSNCPEQHTANWMKQSLVLLASVAYILFTQKQLCTQSPCSKLRNCNHCCNATFHYSTMLPAALPAPKHHVDLFTMTRL